MASDITNQRKTLLRSEIKRCSAAAALATLLLYLAMSGMAPVSRAGQGNTGERDVLISAQQLENAVDHAQAGNQAELTDLETQLQQLNTLQAAIEDKKTIVAQLTAQLDYRKKASFSGSTVTSSSRSSASG